MSKQSNNTPVETPVSEIRDRLRRLRELGYEYLQTHDDAVTWEGSDDKTGIPIDLLITLGTFRGTIVVPESDSKDGRQDDRSR